jgi:hypothetical protein
MLLCVFLKKLKKKKTDFFPLLALIEGNSCRHEIGTACPINSVIVGLL